MCPFRHGVAHGNGADTSCAPSKKTVQKLLTGQAVIVCCSDVQLSTNQKETSAHTPGTGERERDSAQSETSDLCEAEYRGMYTARPHHSHILHLLSPCINAAQNGGSC